MRALPPPPQPVPRELGSHSDLPLALRRAAVAEYRELLVGRTRLARGEGAALAARYRVTLRSISRWHGTLRKAETKGEDARNALASKRFGRAPTNKAARGVRVTHGINLLELWAYCLYCCRKDIENCKKPKLAAELQGKWHAVYCAKKNPTLKASAKDYAFVAKICNTSVKELRSKVRAWAKTRKGTICGAIRFGAKRERRDDDAWALDGYPGGVVEITDAKLFATPVRVNNKNPSETNKRRNRWALAGSVPGKVAWDYAAQTETALAAALHAAL